MLFRVSVCLVGYADVAETYDPAKPKTTIRAYFWRFGSSSPFSSGSGSTAVAMSVRILTAALVNLSSASALDQHTLSSYRRCYHDRMKVRAVALLRLLLSATLLGHVPNC